MTNPTPDAATTRQLALIRLLYLQGVEQAARPEPTSLFSLLSFHDSVELFLVLAADYLGAQMPKGDPGFMDYWHILRPTEAFRAGVSLSGRGRMDRLNRNRNALKHAGALPSREAVDDAFRSTTTFFEDNTELVFGVAFDAIDMADVVPQEDIRKLLKAAATAEAAGDRSGAMAGLTLAFAKLFHPYARSQHSPYGFGREMPLNTTSEGMAAELHNLAKETGSKRAANLRSAAQKADHSVSQLNATVSAMQRGLRIVALGIDYARFTRFEQLTPMMTGDEVQPMLLVDGDYAPNREEYDYCVQFVISAALRLAEIDANAVEPSWERARFAAHKVGQELVTPPR
jgi:hypothetical protein